MGIITIIIASIILIIQYVSDNSNKKRRRKKIFGASILFFGLIAIWVSAYLDNNREIKNETNHKKEVQLLKNNFSKVDSMNLVLDIQLNLRNKDLLTIKKQNDSLKEFIYNVQNNQNLHIQISKSSAQEVKNNSKKIKDLELKMLPRDITLYKRMRMYLSLYKFKGSKIKIIPVQGTLETEDFANQVLDLFEYSKWEVDFSTKTLTSYPIIGVYYKYKSDVDPNLLIGLKNAFLLLNIPLKKLNDGKNTDFDVELLIGEKGI